MSKEFYTNAVSNLELIVCRMRTDRNDGSDPLMTSDQIRLWWIWEMAILDAEIRMAHSGMSEFDQALARLERVWPNHGMVIDQYWCLSRSR